jgi:hypothetical protein
MSGDDIFEPLLAMYLYLWHSFSAGFINHKPASLMWMYFSKVLAYYTLEKCFMG